MGGLVHLPRGSLLEGQEQTGHTIWWTTKYGHLPLEAVRQTPGSGRGGRAPVWLSPGY